jgi:hypothetical protein
MVQLQKVVGYGNSVNLSVHSYKNSYMPIGVVREENQEIQKR